MNNLNPESRLYSCPYPIVGITGGIATGKSTFSSFLKDDGFTVFDADQMVKQIYSYQESLDFIKEKSPSSLKENSIDFKDLRLKFFSSKELKITIEKYIYQKLEELFIKKYKEINSLKNQTLFYDAALIFENALHKKIDETILIYSDIAVQMERVMKRDAVDAASAKSIISAQMPIEDKMVLTKHRINNSSTVDNLKKSYISMLNLLFPSIDS